MFLTCFVRGSHQWTTGCVNEAHIIPNFLPVCKLLWSDVFLHLKATHTLSQCAFRHQICSSVALINVEKLHQVPWFLPSGGVWWAACTDPVLDSPLWPLAALQTTAWSGKWLYFTSQNISGSMSVCDRRVYAPFRVSCICWSVSPSPSMMDVLVSTVDLTFLACLRTLRDWSKLALGSRTCLETDGTDGLNSEKR